MSIAINGLRLIAKGSVIAFTRPSGRVLFESGDNVGVNPIFLA
jgi:hypothetical protein